LSSTGYSHSPWSLIKNIVVANYLWRQPMIVVPLCSTREIMFSQRFSKACLAWAWPCLCPWHTLDRGIPENSGVRDTMRYLALLGDVQRSEMMEGTNDQNWWLNMSAHASCWPMIELMIELINGFPCVLFLFPNHLIRYLGLQNAGEAGDLQQYPRIPTTSWIWILHTYVIRYHLFRYPIQIHSETASMIDLPGPTIWGLVSTTHFWWYWG